MEGFLEEMTQAQGLGGHGGARQMDKCGGGEDFPGQEGPAGKMSRVAGCQAAVANDVS